MAGLFYFQLFSVFCEYKLIILFNAPALSDACLALLKWFGKRPRNFMFIVRKARLTILADSVEYVGFV